MSETVICGVLNLCRAVFQWWTFPSVSVTRRHSCMTQSTCRAPNCHLCLLRTKSIDRWETALFPSCWTRWLELPHSWLSMLVIII